MPETAENVAVDQDLAPTRTHSRRAAAVTAAAVAAGAAGAEEIVPVMIPQKKGVR